LKDFFVFSSFLVGGEEGGGDELEFKGVLCSRSVEIASGRFEMLLNSLRSFLKS
jgi:hypothetical protein